MNHSKSRYFSASLAAVACAALACCQGNSRPAAPESDNLVAQEIARGTPTETTGFEASVLGSVSLEPYGGTLTDASLRAREVVVLPGAKIAVHAHDSRPARVFSVDVLPAAPE